MNKVYFLGNLTKDFEYRTSNNGSVAKGSIALNRGKNKDGQDLGADFINVTAFNKTAELLDKYGKKGRKFLLECHVLTGSYEKDGHKIYTTDFIIDRVEFCDSSRTEDKGEAMAFSPIPDGADLEELPFA